MSLKEISASMTISGISISGWMVDATTSSNLDPECFNLSCFKCHACCCKVTAITQQMFFAGMNGLIKIKSGNTSCTACSKVTGLRKDNSWTIIMFNYP